MFLCPKCNHAIEGLKSKSCPFCSLRFFDEELTTWIGSSEDCNIVLKDIEVPSYAAAITFNKETQSFELVNLVGDSYRIRLNQKIVTYKETITINDWMEIGGIIFDFNHPKITPLFNLNLKINLTIDFDEIEMFTVGNTDYCAIRLEELSKNEIYARIIKCKNNYFCSYPDSGVETTSIKDAIFINEYKLQIDETKLIDENDNIYIEDIKLPLSQIPCFLDDKQPFFLSEKFPIEFDFNSFNKNEVSIGLSNCDIVLISEKISPHHLSIIAGDSGKYFVKDNNSTNGTYLNNKRVTEAEIELNQVITFGDFQIHLHFDKGNPTIHIDHYKGKIRIDAVSISKHTNELNKMFSSNKHYLLNNISLSIDAGEFVGIMGPSGGGKTTLLKILAGVDSTVQKNIAGKIYFNYNDIEKYYDKYRYDIAYLPQDDILFPGLTVYQCLNYSAKLRMPHLTQQNVDTLIDNVLLSMDLAKKEKDGTISFPIKKRKIGDMNKPGAISGGQRKRVNLAIELLSDPSIIFLDEPTSGLSSIDSNNLINLLSSLCNAGNTIVTTIHQPSQSIFQKFNKVLILARNGELAYFGSTQRAVDYFEERSGLKYNRSMNTANFILEALQTNEPEYWRNCYNQSEYHEYYIHRTHSKLFDKIGSLNSKSDKSNGHKNHNWSQFITLVKRNAMLKLNNSKTLLLLLLQAPIIALLIGFIFTGILDDGPRLTDSQPEEDLSRIENYFRPKTRKFLPPYNKNVTIENITKKPLYFYTQTNDVQMIDSAFIKKSGPYSFSFQKLESEDKTVFPVKAGNYKLIISDSEIESDNLAKLFNTTTNLKGNTYYYFLKYDKELIPVNDWYALNDSQKTKLWNEKILVDRANKVVEEDSLFALSKMFESSVLSFLNPLFDHPGFLNRIKKYRYAEKHNLYSWFDMEKNKTILYVGDRDYKEKVLKNLYLIFLVIVSFTWIGMTNSVKDIVLERQIYLREKRYTLKIFNYLSSKFVTLTVLSVIQIFIFLAILLVMIPDIPIDIFQLSLILLLTSMISGGIGLIVSSISNTIEFGISMLPLILIPQIVMAGIFKHIGAMSFVEKMLSSLTVSKWSLEAMMNIISSKVDFESPFLNYIVPFKSIIYPCYTPTLFNNKVISYGYFPFSAEIDYLILGFMLISTFVVSFLILKLKKK